MQEKIKAYLNDDSVYYATIFLLIATISFGLGRWSVIEIRATQPAAVSWTPPPAAQTTPVAEGATTTTVQVQPIKAESAVKVQNYVGSKKGTKYHLPDCPSAKNIAEKNKVWFATKEEAEASGYTPAANCPGL